MRLDRRRCLARLGLDIGGLGPRVGHGDPRVARRRRAQLRRGAQALRRARRRHRLPLRPHPGDGRGQRGIRQGQPLDADLLDLDAVDMQRGGSDLGQQTLLELGQLAARRVGVDEIGEVEAAGGHLQGRADQAAQLTRCLIRIVAHGSDELPDVGRIVRHLPGDIGLHQHPQPVLGADILQPGGCGPQPQIDRDDALERRRQFPGQARPRQHARQVAETGDDRSLAGAHHHGGGREHGGGNDEAGKSEA